MVRAAGKLILIIAIVSTAFGAAAAPDRQFGSLTPAIVEFTADVTQLDYAAVEAGTAQVTLMWSTIHANGQYGIEIDTYHQNEWVSILDTHEALPFNGSKLITVMLPDDYGAPTYRMTIKRSTGQIVGRQFLTIPYGESSGADPSIISFTTLVQSVDTHLLVYSNSKIMIAWQVVNRQPDTQLIVEQLFDPNESGIVVKIVGYGSWLPSTGEGAIMPRTTTSKADLHYRLNLVSASDGTRYDWADITIPVIGHFLIVAPRAVLQGPGTVQPLSVPLSPENSAPVEGDAQSVQPADANALLFNADSQALVQGNVQLNWQAEEGASVQLLQSVEDGPKTLFIQLPPTGSMTVPLPQDANSVTYTLRAQTAEGDVATGELSVITTEPAADGN